MMHKIMDKAWAFGTCLKHTFKNKKKKNETEVKADNREADNIHPNTIDPDIAKSDNAESEKLDKSSEDIGFCILVSAYTDSGKVREKNEDSLFIGENTSITEEGYTAEFNPAPTKAIYAVMDGMGGEAYGEIASQIAEKKLSEYARNYMQSNDVSDDYIINLMNEYAADTNNSICDKLKELNASRGGTTFAGIVIIGCKVFPCNLGDSRVYLYRSGKLVQLTDDHTLAEKKLKANIYTEDDEAYIRESHTLTYFLGVDKDKFGLNMCIGNPLEMLVGDKLLMCTDGLTDMCSPEEIAHILSESSFPSQKLISRALENGGIDNVSCIVLEIISG